jgi:hypothetical protein
LLIVVKQIGVELILSCGLSILVKSGEIVSTRLKSNSLFVNCLKFGGSFPSLRLNVQATDDFRPRWADEPNEGQKLSDFVKDAAESRSLFSPPPSTDDSGDSEDTAAADSTPKDAQPAPSVALPSELANLPQPYHGGGRSR